MKTGSDKRLIMTKNLIMMFVILAVLLMAIFAWYTSNYEVTASQTTISAKATDDVELAVPFKSNGADTFPISNDSWKTMIEFKDSGYLKDLVKDVTSNGKQFVMPNFEAAKGLKEGRKVIADDVWTEGLSSKEALISPSTLDDDKYNYISLDFYMRSKIKNISVTGDSFLAAGCELGIEEDGQIDENNPQIKSLTGTDIYRCSSYGAPSGTADAFSSDAIVGAMRVSLEVAPVDGPQNLGDTFTEGSYNGGTWDAQSALRFLWLPRPDVYLSTDDNSNNWRLYTGIKPSYSQAADPTLTTDQIAELNAIADKTYAHSFYEGNTITGGVKKGLTAQEYYDSNVKLSSTLTATNPTYFKVSQTNNDNQLGTLGYYPTLGQSLTIADNALESSKNIEFTAGTQQGDNRSTDGYYVYKCKLNIWIEGEDAEARRSMNNGVFSLELDFGT